MAQGVVWLALAARLLLLGLQAGTGLVWRPEVSTPANSVLHVREGIRLLQLGVLPYGGATCHAAPLVLALLAPLSQNSVLLALPNVLADLIAAAALNGIVVVLKKMAVKRAALEQQPGDPLQYCGLTPQPVQQWRDWNCLLGTQ